MQKLHLRRGVAMELHVMNGGLRNSTAGGERDAEVAEGKLQRDETDGDPSLALGAALARSAALGDENKSSALLGNGTEEEKLSFEDAAPSHTAEDFPAARTTAVEEDEEDEVEYFCGAGPWHPAWLQRLRDARVFTFLLCLFSTVEGALVSG